MEDLLWYVGNAIYVTLALIALWGAFCVVMVWRRVAQIRYRTEEEQDQFLDTIDRHLVRADFGGVEKICDQDDRAVPQLALMAILNRHLGFAKVRGLVADRFQRDVLSDLEYRISWVDTVIKTAPMVGLLGTVVGMMGAFAKLADPNNKPQTGQLAGDISLALITTACGLAIAIPLVLCRANISVRIRKLEDLVTSGMARFFEVFRTALTKAPETSAQQASNQPAAGRE